MTKKGRQFFFQEKMGVPPSVSAPGDTNPSDAIALNSAKIGLYTVAYVCLKHPKKWHSEMVGKWKVP